MHIVSYSAKHLDKGNFLLEHADNWKYYSTSCYHIYDTDQILLIWAVILQISRAGRHMVWNIILVICGQLRKIYVSLRFNSRSCCKYLKYLQWWIFLGTSASPKSNVVCSPSLCGDFYAQETPQPIASQKTQQIKMLKAIATWAIEKNSSTD